MPFLGSQLFIKTSRYEAESTTSFLDVDVYNA